MVSSDDLGYELIRAAGLTGPPVDLSRVIGLFPGLEVAQEPLDGDGYLVRVPGGAEVVINSRAPVSRQRFTLAHELGHYVIDSELARDIPRLQNSELERWCDSFAVGLLMPAAWVRKHVVESNQPNARRIVSGPRRFLVSRDAFWLRVAEATGCWLLELERTDTGWRLITRFRSEIPSNVQRLAVDQAETLWRGQLDSMNEQGIHLSATPLRGSEADPRLLIAAVEV